MKQQSKYSLGREAYHNSINKEDCTLPIGSKERKDWMADWNKERRENSID